MTNNVRVAMLGLSPHHVLPNLLPAFHEAGADVTAVADLSPALVERACDALEALGAPRPMAFDDAHALLEAPVADAVIIATPTPTHPELALRALRNGFDVRVEKPLAITAVEAAEMVRLAAEQGRVLEVGYQKWRQVAAAIDAIRNGAVGTVRRVEVTWERPLDGPPLSAPFWNDPRTGGVTLDFSHGVDLAYRMIDDTPIRAVAEGWRDQGTVRYGAGFLAEDSMVGHVSHAKGTVLLTRMGWWTAALEECFRFVVTGTDGELVFRVPTGETTTEGMDAELTRNGVVTRLAQPTTNTQAHLAAAWAFLDACGARRMTPAIELLRPQSVLDALRTSLADNGVQVPVVDPLALHS